MKKILATLIFASASVCGMIEGNSLRNKAIFQIEMPSSFDSDYININPEDFEEEYINIPDFDDRKRKTYIPDKSDSEVLMFDISETELSQKESEYLETIKCAITSFQYLENDKKKPGLYRQASANQRSIVSKLQKSENKITALFDGAEQRYDCIEHLIYQYMSAQVVNNFEYQKLLDEQLKVCAQLICFQEALRLSVSKINTNSDSRDRLKKIFNRLPIDKWQLRDLEAQNDLKLVLSRVLYPNNGEKKAIYLNSLKDFVLSSSILNMIPYSHNKIGRIPFSLVCPNLCKFKISDYKKSIEFQQLAQRILCSAPNLESLDISNNDLNSYDLHSIMQWGDWPMKLKSLDLHGNRITLVPELLSRCTNLKELNLNDNHISEKNIPNEKQAYFTDIISFISVRNNLPKLKILHIAGVEWNINHDRIWNLPTHLLTLEIDCCLLSYVPANSKQVISQSYDPRHIFDQPRCIVTLKQHN